ncbi:VOC family protein [Agromyces atrinae]|uniref:VOC family protein n=1 Tax=Agromyces atrinae TaxID=592376 RepID=A0A4V1R2R3_9MICO|nr:VOC family protein [Agromyces atrinae]NYD67756.1 hypothetical protein [Agromyces atrinae]RXZ88056.1 VOC family protein [Agromyces atrinae]
MAKVEHFEIPADDIERAAGFYKAVFDFTYQSWGDEMGVITASDDGGINGDLHKRSTVTHPTVVFTVDRLEDTIAAVVANGDEVVGEIQQLDETSRWVYLRDSEGNIVGAYDEQK